MIWPSTAENKEKTCSVCAKRARGEVLVHIIVLIFVKAHFKFIKFTFEFSVSFL